MPSMSKVDFHTYPDSIATRYVVAVLSSWCSESCTYPFDLLKTRLQIQGEVAASKHVGILLEKRGMFNTALGVVKEEGPLKLWSGLMPMCQRHLVYSGCRLIFYEQIRNVFKDEHGHTSLAMASASGVCAGAMAQWIASPADLIKVQMQAEGRRRLLGFPPRILNSGQAYTLVYKESGIQGLWRGALPNVQRAALVNMGDLAAYDYTKQALTEQFQMPDSLLLHTIAAFAAGLTAAIVGTPADVIKTRLMNQPIGTDGRGALYRGMLDCLHQSVRNEGVMALGALYRGMLDCLHQSVRNEGVMALYRGFVPVWLRLGPWALIHWIAFENIMQCIGGHGF